MADLDWRVAVVRARAGSGKTTALRDWAADHEDVAYLELDDRHDAPDRFLADLAIALGIRASTPVDVTEDARDAVDRLLESTSSGITVLIVDSVERAQVDWVNEALDALVRATGGPGRIVLSGRRVPRLRELAVLRVRDDLIDLGEDELRLDEKEALELFELVCGEADPATCCAVLEATEGWAAGFCLVAKERRSRGSASTEECIELAMPAIRDYLFDDVLDRLSAPLVELLLDVSILDPLSAATCDAIRARSDSARLLRELEHESLFIDRIRREPGRFRLHPMVRSVLEDELATVDGPRRRMLHNRAARWCRGQGDEVGAMRHLVAGGDLDGAWQLFRDHWAERYFAGDFTTVRGWADILADNAQFDVERASELAIAFLLLGRLAQAEHFVVEATLALDASDENHNGCLELARFLHANARGALDIALEHALAARQAFRSDESPIWRRTRSSLTLSSVLAFSDRASEAEIELRRAVAAEDPASPVDAVLFPVARARLALVSGRLAEAEEHAMRAIDAAALLTVHSGPLLSEASNTIGYVMLERNDLVAAERALLPAIEAADRIGYAPVRLLGRLALARVHHARGHRDVAFDLLAECRRLGGARFDRHFIDRVAEVEAHLRLCEGDPVAALMVLPPERGERLRLTEARALAALGDHAGALALASEVEIANPHRAMRVRLVHARCTVDALQRREEIAAAIRLAEVSGFTRLVLDERLWLLEHLHALAPNWPTGYVAALIERSVHELAIRTPADRLARLSERELEVWRQLSTPLSLSEISRRLYISRNTMKTHVRNIYRKLEVATRDAAVAVAVTPSEVEPPRSR